MIKKLIVRHINTVVETLDGLSNVGMVIAVYEDPETKKAYIPKLGFEVNGDDLEQLFEEIVEEL